MLRTLVVPTAFFMLGRSHHEPARRDPAHAQDHVAHANAGPQTELIAPHGVGPSRPKQLIRPRHADSKPAFAPRHRHLIHPQTQFAKLVLMISRRGLTCEFKRPFNPRPP